MNSHLFIFWGSAYPQIVILFLVSGYGEDQPSIAYECAIARFILVKIKELGQHLEFLHSELITGSYDHVIIAAPTTREDGEEGAVIVRMHFRERTDLELRVDALEEGQTVQDGAIEDIGMVLSDIAEG